MLMKASAACLDLIKRFEDEAGFLAGQCSRLTPYLCPAGIWSIGWGHTHGVHQGMTAITPQVADALLLADVYAVEADLRAVFSGAEFTQGAWDALVSLCFNLRGGPRILPRKAPKLTAAIRAGDWPEAAHQLLDINKGKNPKTGKMEELPGLTKRRRAEADLMSASCQSASASPLPASARSAN